MDAVGDVGDGHLIGGEPRPQPTPLLASHRAVQAADAVSLVAEPQREHRWTEGVRRVVRPVAPKCEQLFERDAEQRGVGREVGACELDGKVVVAGAHRGVRGEDHLGRGDPASDVERHVAASLDLGDQLEGGEGRVALVQVQDARAVSAPPQGSHPTDAEHQLLLDPCLQCAAVEPRGDAAVVGGVLRHVGVEEVQPRASDGRGPHLGDDVTTRERHLDGDGLGVGPADERDRK
jgi:hypothetical protein